MKGSRYTFKSEDQCDISAVKWIPENEDSIIGAVQIFHGMAEHIERYDDFARFLNSRGFIVLGNDHRGHGKSICCEENKGFFSDKDGWEKVVKDARKVTTHIQDQHRGLPIFLFTHSMGSFIGRDYISRWGEDLSGVILSGTANQSVLLMKLFSFMARIEIFFRGKRHKSIFFDKLSFGSFNKPFEPQAPTPFEWLSRDREQVDRYYEDPLCGFICTSSFFLDLANGLKRVCSSAIYSEIPENLPILLYSGDEDPVGGDSGSLVKDVYEQFQKAGMKDISIEFNHGGRHESLNESNRLEVYEYFFKWIKERIPIQS